MNYTMGFNDNNGNYATISGWSTGGGDFRAFKKRSQITKPSQFFVILDEDDIHVRILGQGVALGTDQLGQV